MSNHPIILLHEKRDRHDPLAHLDYISALVSLPLSSKSESYHKVISAQVKNIIIIMEMCKCPTYQNILTAQGTYASKNSDNNYAAT